MYVLFLLIILLRKMFAPHAKCTVLLTLKLAGFWEAFFSEKYTQSGLISNEAKSH